MPGTYEILYTGMHCVRESNADFGFSNSDEPYFIFVTTDGHAVETRRSRTYDDVDTGETRREGISPGIVVWRTTDLDAERDVLSLVVTGMEEDAGQESAAERAVRSAAKAGIAATGVPGKGLVGAIVAEVAVALSGLRDDLVGVAGLQFTRDDIRRLAEQPVSHFGSNAISWNVVVRIQGRASSTNLGPVEVHTAGREGTFFAFFRVQADPAATQTRPGAFDKIQVAGTIRVASVGREDRPWTAGAAHRGQALLLSKFHSLAETRRSIAEENNDKATYWRWGGGMQYTHLVPGRFSSRRGGEEFLLYRATDGRFSILDRGGSHVPGVGKVTEGTHHIVDGGKMIVGATSVVTGVFSEHARRHGLTDLLVYRKDGGRQEFYSLEGPHRGRTATRIPDNFKNWRSVWDIITPVSFPGRPFTSLLLYSRSEGRGQFWHMTRQGTIELGASHGFFKTWSHISQVMLPGREEGDVALFFYSKERRSGQVWSFPQVKRLEADAMPEYDFLIPEYSSLSHGSALVHTLYGYRQR